MKIIGHRGAKGLAPENTIASFKKALEYGVDAIECDVHVTRDGTSVLHHDPYFTDPDGTKVAIGALTYQELLEHKPDAATLEEALDYVRGKVELFVEIKSDIDPNAICQTLVAYQREGHAVKVLSFDYRVLSYVRTHFGSLPLTVNEEWSGVRATWRARRLGTRSIQMNERFLWSGFVRAMHRAGYQLSPYTVNDPTRIRMWQPYLYGVVTDFPNVFVR